MHFFFPWFPLMRVITSPGTTSWSIFISFDSFSSPSFPAAFSPWYRSVHTAATLSRSALLPPPMYARLQGVTCFALCGVWLIEQGHFIACGCAETSTKNTDTCRQGGLGEWMPPVTSHHQTFFLVHEDLKSARCRDLGSRRWRAVGSPHLAGITTRRA